MDMSNKSLALLLVAAIVISLGGTLISLNKLSQEGFAGMALGQVQLTVSENMSCTVDSNVSFGSAGKPAVPITISTNKNNAGIPSNFSDCTSVAGCMGLMVNNSGNVDIRVNFSSSVDGSGLVAGAVSDFQYMVYNGTTAGTTTEPGCFGGLPTTWANVPTTATSICTNLTSNTSNNMITMEFNVTIGPDTPPGAKTATITINCGQA